MNKQVAVNGVLLAIVLSGMNAVIAGAEPEVWVENDSGVCVVGPPPICVAGHWHWVEDPTNFTSQIISNLVKSQVFGKDAASIKPSEFSSDVEYESYSSGDMIEGSAQSIRLLYEKSSGDYKSIWGVRGNFETSKAEATFGSASSSGNVTSGSVYYRTIINQSNYITVGYSYAHQNYGSSTMNHGPYANYFFEKYLEKESFLFGAGIQAAYSMLDYGDLSDSPDFEDKKVDVAFGFNVGKGIGSRLFATAEYFIQEDFTVPGVTVQYMISETFVLTAGYKTMLGVEDYSNSKIAIGSSYRF